MLTEKEKLKKLKDFGVWLDEKEVICLAKDIYTEGGKNIVLNKLRMDKDREIKRLIKELKKIKR